MMWLLCGLCLWKSKLRILSHQKGTYSIIKHPQRLNWIAGTSVCVECVCVCFGFRVLTCMSRCVPFPKELVACSDQDLILNYSIILMFTALDSSSSEKISVFIQQVPDIVKVINVNWARVEVFGQVVGVCFWKGNKKGTFSLSCLNFVSPGVFEKKINSYTFFLS